MKGKTIHWPVAYFFILKFLDNINKYNFEDVVKTLLFEFLPLIYQKVDQDFFKMYK